MPENDMKRMAQDAASRYKNNTQHRLCYFAGLVQGWCSMNHGKTIKAEDLEESMTIVTGVKS